MAESIYEFRVYTDGSCKDNGSTSVKPRGGWAYIIAGSRGEIQKFDCGKEVDTTNNIMELTAIIEALKFLEEKKGRICIITDSKIAKDSITIWIKNWKKNGWKTSKKRPVKNKELLQELDRLSTSLKVEWKWIKAHSDIDDEDKKFNDQVDKLAQGMSSKLQIEEK